MPHILTQQDREAPAYAMGFDYASRGKDNYRNPLSGNAIGAHNYYAGFIAGMKAWEEKTGKQHPGR